MKNTAAISKEKVTQRFLEAMTHIIDTYQLATQKDFADSIGVENYQLSKMNIGKTYANVMLIASTVEKYPAINPDYILYGKGQLIRKTELLFNTQDEMWDYIELLQNKVALQDKQIIQLQEMLLKKRAKKK